MWVGLRGAPDTGGRWQFCEGQGEDNSEKYARGVTGNKHQSHFSLINFHTRTVLTLSACRIYILRFHNGDMLMKDLGFSVLQDYKKTSSSLC